MSKFLEVLRKFFRFAEIDYIMFLSIQFCMVTYILNEYIKNYVFKYSMNVIELIMYFIHGIYFCNFLYFRNA